MDCERYNFVLYVSWLLPKCSVDLSKLTSTLCDTDRTIVYGTTQEVATCSNGSLANSRIINASRSPQAVLNILLKFPIDVPLKKVEIFKGALESFIKSRPREWLTFTAFRPTRVEADQGFVEYIVIAQHREKWSAIGALLQSRAELASFSLEVSKKMDMRYIPPALPVDLNMSGKRIPDATMEEFGTDEGGLRASVATDDQSYSHAVDQVAAMFMTQQT